MSRQLAPIHLSAFAAMVIKVLARSRNKFLVSALGNAEQNQGKEIADFALKNWKEITEMFHYMWHAVKFSVQGSLTLSSDSVLQLPYFISVALLPSFTRLL